MRVQVADEAEWPRLVEAARQAGALDVGRNGDGDYDIVINERAGLILVNPHGAESINARLHDAIPHGAAS